MIPHFPQLYLERLEILCYPPWYMACFMRNCSGAAVWGHYGDAHKGICLKFRVTSNDAGRAGLIVHNAIKGYSVTKGGPTKRIRGEEFRPFQMVDYVKTYPEVDFFRSIGRLSWPRVLKTWFSDESGGTSSVAESIGQDMDEWRKEHWKTFTRTCSTKLDAWAYEEEYRLVLSSVLNDFAARKDRVVNYRFSDLEGIIFGIRTPIEAKHRIMKIVDEKCVREKRNDFKFFQAQYSAKDGAIAIREMRSLKISP